MLKSEFLFNVIAEHKNNRVDGKKRLQKLVFLLISSGEQDVFKDFDIFHFGPYSRSLSHMMEVLVQQGDIQEEIKEIRNFFMSSYALKSDHPTKLTSTSFQNKVETLGQHDSVTLEIASTCAFYLKRECSLPEAIKKTKTLKPKKATRDKVLNSIKLLQELSIT